MSNMEKCTIKQTLSDFEERDRGTDGQSERQRETEKERDRETARDTQKANVLLYQLFFKQSFYNFLNNHSS